MATDVTFVCSDHPAPAIGSGLVKIARFTMLSLLGLVALSEMAGPASAADATMRLRGSTQTFTGNVVGFDGKSYLLENEIFGKVYLNISRFECISGACSETATNDAAAPPPQENATIAPSANEQSQSPMTEEQRQELFKEFLEWRKTRDN